MMSNVENQVAGVVIVHAPFGGNRSGGGRSDTVVSDINGGAHLNVYPSDIEMEVVGGWSAASADWQVKDERVEVLILQEANGAGYTCRKRPAQRPHFTIPTEIVGGAADIGSKKVETFRDGNKLCLRVAEFFREGVR
jgi:hypothetical protein